MSAFEGYDGLSEYQREMALFEEAEEHLQAMREAGMQATLNEAEYKKAVAIETVGLQAQGIPATLIKDRVKGMPYVAELEMRAKNANVIRDTEYELSMLCKKRAQAIHDERMREWGSPQGQGDF